MGSHLCLTIMLLTILSVSHYKKVQKMAADPKIFEVFVNNTNLTFLTFLHKIRRYLN